jgi:hypothetical protein
MVRHHLARSGRVLLVAAAGAILGAGLLLALGQPRAHTLLAYAAVGLAGAGVVLTIPAALSERTSLDDTTDRQVSA